MSLAYDFDIVTSDDGTQVALFRNSKTVAALATADPVVRECFAASGFGFDSHNSGAGPGFYPSTDEAAREQVVDALEENLRSYGLTEEQLNGFDYETFLEEVAEAEPIEMRHAAFRFGLPVGRLIETFREARPTRQTRTTS